jgi:hypothetical protein
MSAGAKGGVGRYDAEMSEATKLFARDPGGITERHAQEGGST